MAIEFTCSGCSKTLRVPDEHLGKQARCPQCQTLNTIQPDTGLPPLKTASHVGGHAQPTASHVSNPYQASSNAPRVSYQTAHRGGMILTFGILAIVCNFCLIPGILAWVMGRADLKQIKDGTMDPEGEGLTTAGMIMGMIMTCLAGAVFVIYILIFFFMIIAGVAAG